MCCCTKLTLRAEDDETCTRSLGALVYHETCSLFAACVFRIEQPAGLVVVL
jgi:hypothetical protein